MKTLATLILTLLPGLTVGQTFELYEEKAPFKTVCNRNLDSIRTVDIASGHYKIYFDTSMTKLKADYTIEKGRIEGKYMQWFIDGRVEKEIDFENGLFHGIKKESLIIDGYYLTNIAKWIHGAEDRNIQIEW